MRAGMRTCVIFNPTARGEQAQRFRVSLGRLAGDCAIKPTTGPWTAPALAQAAVREGYDCVIAAGGDGTVSEVAHGIGCAEGGLERVRLGVIPLGTINVFARELQLPLALGPAWAVARGDTEIRVDLPHADCGTGAERRRRWFVQLAGAGLDSRAIERVDWQWKKSVGPLAYVAAGLRAMRGPQPRIEVESATARGAGALVLIGNGRYYGGEVPMFPGANLQDGLLEVRVFPRVSMGLLFRFGVAWLRRRPLPGGSPPLWQADRLTLRCAIDVPFEVDGDNAGRLPVEFGVLPRALRVAVPSAARLRPNAVRRRNGFAKQPRFWQSEQVIL